VLRYAAVHRHVRGQYFTNPNFTAHFSVLCLASGGTDTGNYDFEMKQLNEHINIQLELLGKRFAYEDLHIRFYLESDSDKFTSALRAQQFRWKEKVAQSEATLSNRYYETFQYKVFLKKGGMEIDLADGGMVNWTQKLLQNRKQRLCISGLGLELIERLDDNR
ncbi:MAG: hypothetical protein HKN76_03030, partial [Saprospiraceae bacterium]|nr:hypothetical protein [Saprospiraceae bacterium]